ncbi:MAG: trimeric intracellular cation channel family protein [Rhizobiaceae bacterium]|nr:trimeric intracellular cation channel family protein [Rhizobiaceae bacterium]
MNPIVFFDYAGIAVFAATGALAASRKELDIVGFLFFAGVTAIGGGTLRDIVLDAPVFWVQNTDYLIVPAVVAVAVFFTAHLFESRYKLLLWLDAVGISAYGVFGAWKGLTLTGSPLVAVVMGVLTATFGGVLRDVLAGEQCVLLRPEVYVTAVLAGASVYTVAAVFGVELFLAALLGFAAAFAIRGGALRFGWSIPPYRSRPGRAPEDIP